MSSETENNSVPQPTVNQYGEKVGGWLLFFSICLVVLSPLHMLAEMGESGISVARLGLICFSVYAGICLLGRRHDAVRIAKAYLLVLALVSSGLTFQQLATASQTNPAALYAVPLGILESVFPSLVWYLYLIKSERVARTYGLTHTRPSNLQVGLVLICFFLLFFGGILVQTIGKQTTNFKATAIKDEATLRCSRIGETATKFKAALDRLNMLKSVTSKAEITEGLETIKEVQAVQTQSLNEGQALAYFVRQNQAELRAENLSDVVEISGIYGDTYYAYHNALAGCLAAMKNWLEYSRDNYDAVSQNKPAAVAHYRTLYSEYQSALEKQNRAYSAHLTFAESYARQHPSVSKLINETISQQRTQ